MHSPAGRSSSSSSSNSSHRPNEAAPDREAIRGNVERAAKVLDDILEEVMKEMFVAEAAAYIQSDSSDLTQATAIRNAVITRIDILDANFLAALNGYIRAADLSGDTQLAGLMKGVLDEVLAQVALRLPPTARVLDLALKQRDKDERVATLRSALGGGGGDVPGVSADSLSATMTQFIQEMEEQEVVADRSLLARLCLLKEEVRWILLEASFGGGASASLDSGRGSVPQRCIAFLKELLVVNDPIRRIALLERAFKEDWEGAAPKASDKAATASGFGSGPTPAGRTNNAEAVATSVAEVGGSSGSAAPTAAGAAAVLAAAEQAKAAKAKAVDVVRPGRFLSTLHLTVDELRRTGGESANAAVLKRLEAVQMEAVAVLDRIQRA